MIAMKALLQICCSNTIGKQGIFPHIIKVRKCEHFRYAELVFLRKPDLVLTDGILVKKVYIMRSENQLRIPSCLSVHFLNISTINCVM